MAGVELNPDVEADLGRLEGAAAGGADGDYIPRGESAGPSVSELDQLRQVCGALLSVSFGIVASRRGVHWALSEQEVTLLADPLALVVDKYAPGFSMGPEGALLMAAFAVVMPRIAADRAQSDADAAKAAQGVAGGGQPEHGQA